MRNLNALVDLARANGGLVTRRQAMSAGVDGRRLTELCRSGVLARVSRAVYAVGDRMSDVDPRHVCTGMRVVLSYLSAAAWFGVDLPKPPGLVHVTASRNRGRRMDAVRGVRLHRADLRGGDVTIVRGLQVTSPLRTALDLARHLPLEEAVAVVDSFFRARLLSPEEFATAAAKSAGPGRCRIQMVAMLVDPKSGSILESLARVLLWRNKLAPTHTQYLFQHRRTGWVGYLDFAWPTLRVALECDGYEFHSARDVFQRDRRRWSALVRAGWRPAVVTWFDVTGDPDYVVALVRDLLSPEQSALQHTIGASEVA